ncbi:hypothetical protein [Candidatus Tisiphia endosymbiont of Hybos culiciformis]|uniref:hypothetical protein n=1 Tax=Candidatus Tisiphia endosymbiont of Hybos culiciformis TaxID=3139331 RepID=UPI003CCA92B1
MTNNYKITFKKFWYANCRLLRLSVALLPFWHLTSLAVYTEPTAKTNVNKVDPLFNEKIENYKAFEQVLERQKASAVKGAESETGFNDLVGSRQARAKGSELSNIRAEELEGSGIRESFKEAWVNDYLVDYSKPGMIRHKEDASRIAEGTGRKMEGLIGLLKKLDIDCKQLKGNREIEPEYHLDIQKEVVKDTIYNQVFCEQLRNYYNCSNNLILSCKKKDRILQERTIYINYHFLPNPPKGIPVQHYFLKYFINNSNQDLLNWELQQSTIRRIKENGSVVQQQMKQLLADQLEIPVEDIVSIRINRDGPPIGELDDPSWIRTYMSHDDYFGRDFTVTYKVGSEECTEWQEDWSEICTLN